MNSSSLKLVEIHDTDLDHHVGGQDLPYMVTASYEGTYQAAVDVIGADKSLGAFNIQPADTRCKLPRHLEFCTFERHAIYRFFDVTPPLTQEQEFARRYWRTAYARTVGELRAAIADTYQMSSRRFICVTTRTFARRIGSACTSRRIHGNGRHRIGLTMADTVIGQ
ncbi:hypothetical protein [Burkholderia pseudomallei]|uniref:Uncharacterized protein n=1 Tax=Burkholderia pseudomallei TaxID=28450 RepID=A0AA40MF94_BURPE|nr:hypothetical protein [Burkholderia pseudomallei]KGS77534.1 hypothetical protein X942_4586 [Burkholderia pseudomallei MSHR5596]KGX17309.1 hypothetical protein Y036_5967 [Burkholderia pseudomallei]